MSPENKMFNSDIVERIRLTNTDGQVQLCDGL